MKTVFITGASSGIGKETVILFSKMNWNVIATMRNPEKDKVLRKMPGVAILQCDVTNTDSIKQAVKDGISRFGSIDVLVNNAGFYTVGVLEAATETQIRKQIDTNLTGLINVTKEILPYFRTKKQGVIVNISSIAGRTSVPLQSLYHATKWGVEGFSESLQYEVAPFNIKVKLIEPGVIKTDFYGRSMTMMKADAFTDYEDYAKKVSENLIANGNQGSSPQEVAKMIYRAANDRRNKIRYPVGKSSGTLALYKLLPRKLFFEAMNKVMTKEK